MAQYLILIYESEEAYASATPQDYQNIMDAHNRFPDQAKELGGEVVGGKALQPTTTATTIRGDIVTDGPFAETREQLGGYFLIDAPNLDEAIGIAERIPMARSGTVEIRPVMEIDGLPVH